jgi:hypothetical protein
VISVTVNDNGNTGSGGGGNVVLGSVNVDIAAINDDPTNAGGLPTDVTAIEDVASAIDLSAIDISDVDSATGALTVTLSTSTGGTISGSGTAGVTVAGSGTGTISLSGDQTSLNAYLDLGTNIQYTSVLNANGNDIDTISVTVTDNGNVGSGGGGLIFIGSTNVDVTPVNDAPTASGETFSMNAGNTLSAATPGVIFNDIDVDGDTLTTILVTPTTGGTLTLVGDGSFTYTPTTGFFGIASFFYQVTDGSLVSNTVEVQITVLAGIPDPDRDPEPEPEPEPDPDPEPEAEPDPEPEPEEDPVDEPGTETPTTVVPPVTGSAFARVPLLPDSSDEAAGLALHQEDEMSIESAFAGLFSDDRLEFGSQQYSPQVEMLERLLQLDLEQAIVWQAWDQTRESFEDSSVSYVVGSAGTAAGLFSIGYVVWALRGGAFVTAMSSALPAWRIVDPTTLLTAYRTARSPGDAVENMLG